MDNTKSIVNQKFFIKYNAEIVDVYEIISKNDTKLFFSFQTKDEITSIQFNPLVPNIIILSFVNGTCKIYNILNKNEKEDILFENSNKENISSSLFNIFDPNIIATITKRNIIYIWDIRKLYYLNIINIENVNIKIKWSYFDVNFLELRYTKDGKTKVRLMEVTKKSIISSQEVDEGLIKLIFYI